MTTPSQASNAPVDKAIADQIVREIKGKVAQMGIRLPSTVTYFIHTVSRLTITRKTATADISYSGEIRVNPDFWQRMPVGQRSYLIMHEIMHPFCAHGARRGNRDPTLWNIAGDAVINTILDQTTDLHGEPLFPEADRIPGRITMPAGFTGDLTTERIYDYILRNAPPPPPQPPPPPDQGDDEDEDDAQGSGMPSPSDEEGEEDEGGDEDGDGEGEGGDDESDEDEDGDGDGDGDGEEGEGEPSDKPGKGKGKGKGKPDDQTPDVKPGEGCGIRDDDEDDTLEDGGEGRKGEQSYPMQGKPIDLRDIPAIDHVQAQAEAIERASNPQSRGAEGHGLAGRAGSRDGRADWKAILRSIVAAEMARGGDKPTYSRASRREGLDRGIVRPGYYDDKVRIGVALDVSGSVSRDWVERAVGECFKLMRQWKNAEIWACAHTSVLIGPVWLNAADRKKSEEVLSKLAGNTGGTLFAPAYEAADAANPRLDVLIHFTDGGLMEAMWPRLKRVKKLVVIVVGAPIGETKGAVPPGTQVFEATDNGAKPA